MPLFRRQTLKTRSKYAVFNVRHTLNKGRSERTSNHEENSEESLRTQERCAVTGKRPRYITPIGKGQCHTCNSDTPRARGEAREGKERMQKTEAKVKDTDAKRDGS